MTYNRIINNIISYYLSYLKISLIYIINIFNFYLIFTSQMIKFCKKALYNYRIKS